MTALWDTSNLDRMERLLAAHQNVWNEMPDPIIVTTADPHDPIIVMVNSALLTLTGYSIEEVLGRSPRMFQGPDTDRATLDEVRTSLTKGEAIQVTVTNYRKDCTPFRNTFSITPVRDPDKRVTHFVSVQRFEGMDG